MRGDDAGLVDNRTDGGWLRSNPGGRLSGVEGSGGIGSCCVSLGTSGSGGVSAIPVMSRDEH
jgi:hypothetical protein